ncbi:MAG: 3-deoxy-7-phosphoheptulonate synthase, partial [Candidatus Latescibacteria bacterium]|nr:3-deoxy-7-phosphoheptulonate synthase [Candidatus Latescibacterota bacterium]
MSFERIQEIPSPEEVLETVGLPKELQAVKEARDREINAIFEGKSDRFLLIIGPCSADQEEPVCEYINRLGTLQEAVADRLVLVPRIYTNKPRTTGEGYKGMGHQPDPQKEPNIVEGLYAIRKMHIRAIRETHLTAADEMLYPTNLPYVEDLLSYIAVGARSVENQHHRLTCSGVDLPVGMKNPTSGDVSVMLNAIHATQIPHIFIYNQWEVKTSGNHLAHGILRGGVDSYGRSRPNYHYEDLTQIAEAYLERDLLHPTLIIDCNHNNSGKQYAEQPRIGLEVVQSRQRSDQLKQMIRGLMVESYLVAGAQGMD